MHKSKEDKDIDPLKHLLTGGDRSPIWFSLLRVSHRLVSLTAKLCSPSVSACDDAVGLITQSRVIVSCFVSLHHWLEDSCDMVCYEVNT
jgi:hypothetical protein